MAISFTPSQIKKISNDLIALPELITVKENSKISLTESKDDLKNTDDSNTLFYDEVKDEILFKYIDELKSLNGKVHNKYDTAKLTQAAQEGFDTDHFPTTPVYKHLQPKPLSTNDGIVDSTDSDNESTKLATLTANVNILKTGYTGYGNNSETTTGSATDTTVTVGTSTNISNGDKILIFSGGSDLYATVTGVTQGQDANPPSVPVDVYSIINYSKTAGSSGQGAGATLRNYHGGFSNSEREGTSTPSCPNFMSYLKGLIESSVNDVEGHLNTQKTKINENQTTNSTEKADNITATTNCQNLLDAIGIWEGKPATGGGVGRFGDTSINPLEAATTTRTPKITERDAKITTGIGTVSQGTDGKYTGSGWFLSLMNWIDARINMASGSLSSYYRIDKTLPIIQQGIDILNFQKSEYEKSMVARAFTTDSNAGTNVIMVSDVSGLSVNDPVKVCDNDQSLQDTTIQNINGTSITLANNLNNTLLVEKVARIIKIL